jgi:hypothetical protein
MLLAMATAFVASGIVMRIGGLVRRRLRPNEAAQRQGALENQ